MKKDDFFKKIDWTRNNLGKPLEIEGDFWITVKAPERGFANGQELDRIREDAATVALDHLLEFFALKANDDAEAFTRDTINKDEWFLDHRPNAQVQVLTKTPIEQFKTTFPDPIVPSKTPDQIRLDSAKLFDLEGSEIDELVENITGRLKSIREELRIWDGTTPNFSPIPHERHLKELRPAIEELLLANGIRSFSGTITFAMNVDFEITNILYNNEELLKGINVFFSTDVAASPRSLSLLLNYLEDSDTFLDENTGWIDVLNKYFFPPIIIKPGLKKTSKFIEESYNEVIDALLPDSLEQEIKNTFAKNAEDRVLTTDFKLGLRKRREGEVDFVGDDMMFGFEVISPSLSTIEDCFTEVLDRIDLSILIELILRCIPDFSIDFPFFQIPTFEFPELPVIDLLLFIRLNLEELLRRLIKTILQLLIQMLFDMLSRFCEDAQDLGGDGAIPGQVDIFDVARPSGVNPVDIGIDILTENNEDDGGIDQGTLAEFIREVGASLTASQLCGLLSGMPTKLTLEIINDLLDQPRFSTLRAFFNNDQKIIDFFKNMGNMLGQVSVRQAVCEVDPSPMGNPCDSEDAAERLMRDFYNLKRQRGESIPDEFIDQAVKKSKELKKNLTDAITELANNPNIFEMFGEELNGTIDDFKPAEQLPEGTTLATDAIVDGMFDLVDSQFVKSFNTFFEDATSVIGELAASQQDPFATLSLAFQFIPSDAAISFGDKFVQLASQVPASAFFSIANLFPASRTFFQTEDILNLSGLTKARENVKQSQLQASVKELSDSFVLGVSPFERAMFFQSLDAFINVNVIEWSLAALPTFMLFAPGEAFRTWERVIKNSIKAKLANETREVARALLAEETFDEYMQRKTENAFGRAITQFLAPLNNELNVNAMTVEEVLTSANITFDESQLQEFVQSLGDVAIYSREQFHNVFQTDDTKVSKAFDDVINVMRLNLDGISKGMNLK